MASAPLSGQDAGVIVLICPTSMGKYSAETKSQRPDLLQPVSVSRAQLDRTVLQQDQAVSACRDRYDKLAANYLAFIKIASIRIWLRANESTP
jgi:transposase